MRRLKRNKKEFEIKLEQEFPFMRQKEVTGEQWEKGGYTPYDAYGFQCQEGWYNVLRGLCLDITKAYEKAETPVDIIVNQVKEKFGKLRFYKCYPEGHDPGKSDLHREIAEIVSKWEKESANVCEECGATAKVRKDNGWLTTLCDSCYADAKARRDAYEQRRKERKENPELAEAERKAELEEKRRCTFTIENVQGNLNCKDIFIGKWVRYIDKKLFGELKLLEEITVEEGHKNLVSIDGILFEDSEYDGEDLLVLFVGSDGILFKDSEYDGEKDRRLVRYPARKAQSPVSYDIPEGVTSILSNAFKGCENITAVNIPKTMESIGIGAFSDSGIKRITVDPENQAYTSIGGVLFSKYKTKLYACPPGKESYYYDVPEDVSQIWHDAFRNARNLVLINIPDSVGFIGNDAFEGCHKNLLIRCRENSYAFQYATTNGFNCELISPESQ